MTLFRWRSPRSGDELAWAHRQWEQGNVVPHYLTCAFNSRGLTGPDVDLACGAVEPDVDRWEAGAKYPTWEQILRTAKLCRVSPASLMRLSPDPAERAKLPEPPPATYSRCGLPIMTFTDEAIAAILPRFDRASTD